MVADRRGATERRLFWFLGALAMATLAWLGRGMTFWSDEWAIIANRSLTNPATWWAPHNEHWSTVPIIVYRALVETIGLRSYVPYLALVAILHVLIAWLTYRAVERAVGPRTALASGAVVLFFGSGFENLYWGFQIGFVGAMLAGLVALEAIDGEPSPRRAAVVSIALLVGVMTAGVGLFFVVAAGVMLVAEPRWRRWLWVLAVPTVAYAAWYVLIGRSGIGVFRDPFTAQSFASIPVFLVRGLEAGLGAATGLPILSWGLVVLAAAGSAIALSRGARPSGRVVALAAAVVTEYVLIAMNRAGVTLNQVDYPRYTYISGILMVQFLALTLGPALAAIRARAVAEHDRVRWRASLALAAAILTTVLTSNVALLVAGRGLLLDRASITRALISESIRPDPVPGANMERDLVLVPAPVIVRRLVADYGSPVTDAILPWAVEPIQARHLAEARGRLVDGPPPIPPDQ